MRVTLVISSLGGGGAERVAVNMANYWACRGWQITILIPSHRAGISAYDIRPEVVVRVLSSLDARRSRPDRDSLIEAVLAAREILAVASAPERQILTLNLESVAKLRRAIKETRPEAVISFIEFTNIKVLLATMAMSVPVIVSERCDPHFNKVAPGIDLLRRRLYPRATYVVSLTDEAMSFFSGVNGIRGRVIPNPVLPPVKTEGEEAGTEKTGMTLMGMGRLSPEKGFDLLLRAFALVSNDHPAWSLEIWGDGPQFSWLQEMAANLGLDNRVRFPGFTRLPHEAMRRADLFALSSVCEAFPNALCEAMAVGLPVVSFDCPSGPRHIIRDGIDGVLVPSPNCGALATALDHLMRDEGERRRLAARAPEVVERFSIEKVMGMWEEILPRRTSAAARERQ